MPNPKDRSLYTTILDSIWARIQWDFLLQNPQLSEWLEGSWLEATGDVEEGKPVYRMVVRDHAQWFSSHNLVIRRSLSVELKQPVVVRVVAAEAVSE